VRLARFAAVAAVVTFARCGGMQTTPPGIAPVIPADAHVVIIHDYKFEPKVLTVPVGATVTWVNHDNAPHTATRMSFHDEPFDTNRLPEGETYSHTFRTAGSYGYLCAYHQGMTGTIVVQ
jgi:plastocyanin